MSGEYTPTTEAVREAWQYANGACDCCRNGFHKPDYEAFDRWHAEELRKARYEGWVHGMADAEQCIDYTLGGDELYDFRSMRDESFPNPYRADQIERGQ